MFWLINKKIFSYAFLTKVLKEFKQLILALYILMDYPIYIATISMEYFILYFKGLPVKTFYKISMMYFCLSLKIVFIIVNSADPDEMPLMQHFIWDLTVYQSTCLPYPE